MRPWRYKVNLSHDNINNIALFKYKTNTNSEATINKLLDFIFERQSKAENGTSDGYQESPIVYIIEILLTILDSGSINQNFFKCVFNAFTYDK